MKFKFFLMLLLVSTMCFSCKDNNEEDRLAEASVNTEEAFNYNVEEFADIKILRYQIPGWEDLNR